MRSLGVRRNKSHGVARKLHIRTRKNGTGKDAIGKPSGLSVVATMKIAINERLCGPYLPLRKMLVNIKDLATEPTTKQRSQLQVKRKERKHLTQLKIVPNTQHPAVPITTRQNI